MVELQVNAALAELATGDKRPDVAAYAYSAGGKLLDTRALDAKGSAALKLPLSAQATSVRVLVGPRLPKDTPLDEVLRRGAQESHLRVDAKTARASIDVGILRDDWLCWLRSACTVRGTLLKRVTSGGVHLDLPVCQARVEIFEVDPLWIILPKLPIDILQRIRDIIIDPRRIPEPIPGPDPAPFAIRSAPASEHTMDDATASALKAVTEATELRFLAQTGSRLQFEQALIRNAAIVRPLLCFFYPRFVTMQKVGETFTDDCGHFRTLFFKGCNNADTPDLYFKAHQRIFGFFEVTIYAPDAHRLLHVVGLCVRHRSHLAHHLAVRRDLLAVPAGHRAGELGAVHRGRQSFGARHLRRRRSGRDAQQLGPHRKRRAVGRHPAPAVGLRQRAARVARRDVLRDQLAQRDVGRLHAAQRRNLSALCAHGGLGSGDRSLQARPQSRRHRHADASAL
jgi:hypothetical protein